MSQVVSLYNLLQTVCAHVAKRVAQFDEFDYRLESSHEESISASFLLNPRMFETWYGNLLFSLPPEFRERALPYAHVSQMLG
jgi:hypothetical protein